MGVGGRERRDKCIYLHQHSIKKIKQHVLKRIDEKASGLIESGKVKWRD